MTTAAPPPIKKKASHFFKPVIPTLPTPRRDPLKNFEQPSLLPLSIRPASSPNLRGPRARSPPARRRLDLAMPGASPRESSTFSVEQSSASIDRPCTPPPDLSNVHDYFSALEMQIEEAFKQQLEGTVPIGMLPEEHRELMRLREQAARDELVSRRCKNHPRESGKNHPIGVAAAAPAMAAAATRPMQPPPRPPSVSRLLSRARHAAHAARQSLFSAGTIASWDPVLSQYQEHDSAGPSSAPPPPPKPKKSEHLCALLEQAYVDLDPLPCADRRTTMHTDSLRQVVNANLQRVMDIFHQLDTDDSGEVDRREFHTGILTLVGNEHPTSELDELFDTIDTSGDGRISYRELYRTIRGGVQSSTQPTATAALPIKPQALPQQAPQQQPAQPTQPTQPIQPVFTLRPQPPSVPRSAGRRLSSNGSRGSAGSMGSAGGLAPVDESSASISSHPPPLAAATLVAAPPVAAPTSLPPLRPSTRSASATAIKRTAVLETEPQVALARGTPMRAASATIIQHSRRANELRAMTAAAAAMVGPPAPSAAAANVIASAHAAAAVATAATANAEAAESAAAAATAQDPSMLLHPQRQREVIKLYKHFRLQHQEGVCRVARFSQLLKLKFPTEDRAHREAMLQLCAAHEQAEAEAAAKARTHKINVEKLFCALDVGGEGTIDLDEFLNLSKLLDVPRSRLRAMFLARDVDGSGDLDLDEFSRLVDDMGLLEHAETLAEHAEARRTDLRSQKELWRIGLPEEKPKTKAIPKLTERPSLANLSCAMGNVRRAMTLGEAGTPLRAERLF